MFPGLTLPFAIERTRRNPLREQCRNFVINRGDDIAFAIQVYADLAGTPMDLTGAVVCVSITRSHHDEGCCGDYGWGWWTYRQEPVWQGVNISPDPSTGLVVDASAGCALIMIPRAVTACWHGRLGLTVSLDSPIAGAVLARGVLDVIGGVVTPRAPFPGGLLGLDGRLLDGSGGAPMLPFNVPVVAVTDETGTDVTDETGAPLTAGS